MGFKQRDYEYSINGLFIYTLRTTEHCYLTFTNQFVNQTIKIIFSFSYLATLAKINYKIMQLFTDYMQVYLYN